VVVGKSYFGGISDTLVMQVPLTLLLPTTIVNAGREELLSEFLL
jgi:hypothetical protein